MPTYTWKNETTGEVVEVQRTIEQSYLPPKEAGIWIRVIAPFGVGRVEGGGGSPSRPSVIKKETA